jgi:hypothetical protein
MTLPLESSSWNVWFPTMLSVWSDVMLVHGVQFERQRFGTTDDIVIPKSSLDAAGLPKPTP